MSKQIITVSREFGSGGRTVGKRVAELLGVPTILVIGRGFKDGVLELKDRRSGEAREVSVENAVAEVIAEVRGA